MPDIQIFETGVTVANNIIGTNLDFTHIMAVIGNKQALLDQMTVHGKVHSVLESIVKGEMRFKDDSNNGKETIVNGAWFLVNSIEEFLSRKDFTINAMAVNYETGTLVDPYNGRKDIEEKILRCVNIETCFVVPVKILTALKYMLYFDLKADEQIHAYLSDPENILALQTMDNEAIREQLLKMFAYDTLETLKLLEKYPNIREQLFFSNELQLYPINQLLRDLKY